ncbi:hypothetical protein EMEDMD4_10113 [Sinorhizobium medicae]|uniref:Uncharacterized protein n=1 Tax=Sinorhizobium medicae TaxID=110321 RepID=A0A508WQ42_9HYPH|nr:hypothetical protein EMEDMD4_10113 [Sinorhizobium medicae]
MGGILNGSELNQESAHTILHPAPAVIPSGIGIGLLAAAGQSPRATFGAGISRRARAAVLSRYRELGPRRGHADFCGRDHSLLVPNMKSF